MLAVGRLDGSPRRNVKYEHRPARSPPPVNTGDVTNAGLSQQRWAVGAVLVEGGELGVGVCVRRYLLHLLNIAGAKVTV